MDRWKDWCWKKCLLSSEAVVIDREEKLFWIDRGESSYGQCYKEWWKRDPGGYC